MFWVADRLEPRLRISVPTTIRRTSPLDTCEICRPGSGIWPEPTPRLEPLLEPSQESLRNPESRESERAFQTLVQNADCTAFCVLTSLGWPLQWGNRSKSQSHVTFRTGGVAFWPLPPAVLVYCRGPRLFSLWPCAGAGVKIPRTMAKTAIAQKYVTFCFIYSSFRCYAVAGPNLNRRADRAEPDASLRRTRVEHA